MKINIDVDGKSYIPFVAVSIATGGFFTTSDLINLILSRGEIYGQHRTFLDAFEFLPYGRLTYVDREKLISIAEFCFGYKKEPPMRLVAGIVLPEVALRDLMQTVSELESPAEAEKRKRPVPSWDIEAPLPPAVLQAMYKYLPIEFEFTTQRKNGSELMAERINSAVNQIALNAGQSNIPFDRTGLPGHKTDFIKILRKIDQRIVGASSTLGEYFSKLGLRWRQGSKAADAAPLLALYGLTVG